LSKYIHIPNFGAKIDLLLRSDRFAIRTNAKLSEELGVEPDYLSRIKSGTRPLTEENFLTLCRLYNLEQRVWLLDIETFGKRLGFSRKQVSLIAKKPLPGIDFASRIRDERIINDTFDLIGGYWESYYYSVSTTDKRRICRDLLIIRRVNEDAYIECELKDVAFSYSGWCFPIKNHFYIVLEKDRLFNEIIVYATNLPDRQPPKLYGIMLCISGGVDDTHAFPSAAKVVCKYIAKDKEEVRAIYKLADSVNVESFLREKVARYLDPEDEEDSEIKKIAADIANNIDDDMVPFALRMAK
jgi:transcriptional regulator with XRE-family HTH domain